MAHYFLIPLLTFLVALSGCSSSLSEPTLTNDNEGLIVFSALDTNRDWQLYLIMPDGSQRKRLTDRGNNVTPRWSPDGKAILFASDRTGTREIYMMDEDGTHLTQVETSVPGNKLTPSRSHDLSRIAFALESPLVGHPEIWIMDADGSNPVQLTNTPEAEVGPTWSIFPRFSPDDQKILYASTKSSSSQIWVMNADGSNQQQLTTGLGSDFPDANAPNWSPNGNSIAFWSGFETKHGEIWLMNADGTNPRQLTDEPGTASSDNPAWSPDGRHIIFDTSRSGRVEIWIMNVDGSDQRKIIDVGSNTAQFSWQPLSAE